MITRRCKNHAKRLEIKDTDTKRKKKLLEVLNYDTTL